MNLPDETIIPVGDAPWPVEAREAIHSLIRDYHPTEVRHFHYDAVEGVVVASVPSRCNQQVYTEVLVDYGSGPLS